jgi:hypothetical protein
MNRMIRTLARVAGCNGTWGAETGARNSEPRSWSRRRRAVITRDDAAHGIVVVSLLTMVVMTAAFAHAHGELKPEAVRLLGRIDAPPSAFDAPVEPGRPLYRDERLSADGKTACGTCHPALDRGADRRPASIDARGKASSRNSPTVFNSPRQPMLRWLGDRRPRGREAAEQRRSNGLPPTLPTHHE